MVPKASQHFWEFQTLKCSTIEQSGHTRGINEQRKEDKYCTSKQLNINPMVITEINTK